MKTSVRLIAPLFIGIAVLFLVVVTLISSRNDTTSNQVAEECSDAIVIEDEPLVDTEGLSTILMEAMTPPKSDKEILKELTEARFREGDRAPYLGLCELGFIVKFNREAKSCIVNDRIWKAFTKDERARYYAVNIIGTEMAIYNTRPGFGPDTEVTLISCETGEPLAYKEQTGMVHLYR